MAALTGSELCAKLQVDRKQLTAWLKEGLPHSGTRRRPLFDPSQVRSWLVERGYAQPAAAVADEQPIVRTLDQVAQYFGVSTRTVQTWIKQGMPGRAGRPGTREGWFPLGDIDRWLSGRTVKGQESGDETRSQSQARMYRARAELLELEVRRTKSELIDAQEEMRRVVRIIHEAKAQTNQLPSRILKRLPGDLSPESRRKIRADVQRVLDRFYESLQQFCVREAAEAADGPAE